MFSSCLVSSGGNLCTCLLNCHGKIWSTYYTRKIIPRIHIKETGYKNDVLTAPCSDKFSLKSASNYTSNLRWPYLHVQFSVPNYLFFEFWNWRTFWRHIHSRLKTIFNFFSTLSTLNPPQSSKSKLGKTKDTVSRLIIY